MRSLLLSSLVLLAMAGCRIYTSEITGTAGEDSESLGHIDTLYVLPVELPEQIHGEVSAEEEEVFRRQWPIYGARLIANSVNEEVDGLTAMLHEGKPETGHYFQLTVTYLDYGHSEIPIRVIGVGAETKTHVRAEGRIIDAQSGVVVVKLSFVQGTAYGIDKPFEYDMHNLGREFGQWLQDRR